jgi:hypothetical protein
MCDALFIGAKVRDKKLLLIDEREEDSHGREVPSTY